MSMHAFDRQRSGEHRHLHSFPTRRSSDLLTLAEDGPVSYEEGGLTSGEAGDGTPQEAGGPAPPQEGGVPPQAQDGLKVRDEDGRSEEHTSELQSRENLVCRLLLEKKKHTQ